MGVAEEPILSRLDRLDNMVRRLEEMKGSGRWSPSSSHSTGTSEGQQSWSVDVSPGSMEKHCLPIHRVMVETELKGTLLHRLSHLEDRLLKLCLQLEEELHQAERKTEEQEEDKPKKQKGLRKLVNKVVRGGSKHHTNNHHDHHL